MRRVALGVGWLFAVLLAHMPAGSRGGALRLLQRVASAVDVLRRAGAKVFVHLAVHTAMRVWFGAKPIGPTQSAGDVGAIFSVIAALRAREFVNR